MMKALAIALLAAAAATPAWAAGSPPRGVYGCYDVSMMPGRPMVITPTPVAMFGLIDDSTYADWDGHHGHYRFDGTMLTMTDGSREGWRYRKTGDWSFTLIDNRTGNTAYTCPLDPAKEPSHGPW